MSLGSDGFGNGFDRNLPHATPYDDESERRAAVVEPPREGPEAEQMISDLSAVLGPYVWTHALMEPQRDVLRGICRENAALRSALSAAQQDSETMRAERDGIRQTYSQLAAEYDRLYASYNAVADAAASRPPSTDGPAT